MEYLSVYSWAILSVMIVGVALWKMGVFSPPVGRGTNGFVEIKPIDFALSTGGNGTIVVINVAGLDVKITNATITPTIPVSMSNCTTNVTALSSLRAGSKSTITISGCSAMGAVTGDTYRYKLTIGYINLLTDMSHKSTGWIWGPFE